LFLSIMFLLFLSYKVGFIAMLPNCFPIIVSFGVMGWFGIPPIHGNKLDSQHCHRVSC